MCILRTQGVFPAPEEAVSSYMVAPFVAGDARGSHHMPLVPVAVDTPVAGPYCLPIVACAAYSVTKQGKLSEGLDVFGSEAWDERCLGAQRKGSR